MLDRKTYAALAGLLLMLAVAVCATGASGNARLVEAGRLSFWMDVPPGWTELHQTRRQTLCAGADRNCVVIGEFLGLVPVDADTGHPDARISFNLRTLDSGQSLSAFVDRDRACVWPRAVSSLRCISGILPVAQEYASVELPPIDAQGTKVPLVEFHPRSGERPVYAVAYALIGKEIVQSTLRAANQSAYAAAIGDFRRLMASIQTAPEAPGGR